MVQIFSEAFTDDLLEIQTRDREFRQLEMMQEAFQEVDQSAHAAESEKVTLPNLSPLDPDYSPSGLNFEESEF